MLPSEQEKFKKAKKRVADIKGFYVHLIIYLLVNFALFLGAIGIFSGFASMHMPNWGYFTTPFFWGIGLFFHGLRVFGGKFSPFKNWEERKIKEYLEKEENDLRRF